MESCEMGQIQYDIVTLKPKWSIKDLFTQRNGDNNRERILKQLNGHYLEKGWELTDDIIWGKEFSYAVMKLGRPSKN